MKTSALTQNGTIVPSLFQIASYFEDFVPAAGVKKPAPAPGNIPFADLLSHPKKLQAMLKSALTKNDTPAARRTTGQSPARLATRSAAPKEREVADAGKPDGPAPCKPHKIEFFLEAPSAKSVKLAADFTDWEKFPYEMMRAGDGVWFSVIWLAPGQYSYRYIVDGQWCDDPRSTRRVPNPFGSENAVIAVT